MAYATKHMRAVLAVPGVVPLKIWAYDTVDALSDIYAAGYISDGKALGFLKGDIVIVRRWTTAVPVATSELKTPDGTANDLVSITLHWAIGINATTGAVDLTDGLAITATNT